MNPLPIREGLNPTRAQVPLDWPEPFLARDFLWHLISTQRHRHPEDDERAVEERFAHGHVRLDNGQVLSANDVLSPGTFVNFYRTPAPEREVPGELRLLHSDDTLLVIDKPPFLSTLPRGQHIRQTALVKARVQFNIPDLSPCHRLDRLTRGVLMMTVRPEARGAYQSMFDQRLPRKTYEAITPLADKTVFSPIPRLCDWQTWAPPSVDRPWQLSHHMVKVRGRLSTYLDESVPLDKMNACTLVTGVRQESRSGRDVLVWTLQPKTGRTHQLRVVMRSLGLPILNDPLYEDMSDHALLTPEGEPPRPAFVDAEDFSRPMGLIAKRLEFTDPLTGDERKFTSLF
ncbi:pseudouridine synthase [Corynebacterium anserum]|uniref:RNA pseudouridylate synthase n=1 Tax=Corynebacterium anserum TaxID=2684406 RepID=A0A7G7YLK0_9CORY|nr:pseudouridine synthase [Corynebacterium anserum]QNH95370.1 pseudouridylate synthase [Corynebacterium anserum]